MPLFDLDVYGRETGDGEPITHTDDDALSNAITSWFSSRRGEFINEPTLGGPLDFLQFKQLTDNVDSIQFGLLSEIDRGFGGVLSVNALAVRPDYELRTWRIALVYTSNITGQQKELAVAVTANVATNQPLTALFAVDYEDDNLINFIVLKQAEQPNERLIFNENTGIWTWGKYQFTSFSVQSDNFEQVLLLINGGA